MWELDCEESSALKNWCFWTVVLEKTLESPLNCKEIQPVHFVGDQPWDFFGRTDGKAETPILWTPHAKSWLTGKDWCWEGLGAGEEGDGRGWDGWMASLTLCTWVGDGQGGLACCNSWGRKESDTTEQLNRTELNLEYWQHKCWWGNEAKGTLITCKMLKPVWKKIRQSLTKLNIPLHRVQQSCFLVFIQRNSRLVST